jgi:hypothetical protein
MKILFSPSSRLIMQDSDRVPFDDNHNSHDNYNSSDNNHSDDRRNRNRNKIFSNTNSNIRNNHSNNSISRGRRVSSVYFDGSVDKETDDNNDDDDDGPRNKKRKSDCNTSDGLENEISKLKKFIHSKGHSVDGGEMRYYLASHPELVKEIQAVFGLFGQPFKVSDIFKRNKEWGISVKDPVFKDDAFIAPRCYFIRLSKIPLKRTKAVHYIKKKILFA